jgi:hypothetical protein
MNTFLLQAGPGGSGDGRPGQRDAPSASVPDPSRLRRVAAHGAVLVAAVLAAGCIAPPRHAYARNEVVRTAPPSPPPMYFYPERQQSNEAQDRDRFECYRWASRESGVDPGMTPVRKDPQQRVVSTQADPRDGAPIVVGAMTGAALGAMSSPHHPGDNAVIGAIFGAALGAIAQESRAQAIEQSQARRQQADQAAAQASAAPFDNFRRAMSACMSGRGYRVG